MPRMNRIFSLTRLRRGMKPLDIINDIMPREEEENEDREVWVDTPS